MYIVYYRLYIYVCIEISKALGHLTWPIRYFWSHVSVEESAVCVALQSYNYKHITGLLY